MNTNTILWIYIILLVAGGMVGYLKAGSKASILTSVIFAALLILCTIRGFLDPKFGNTLADIILAVLLVFFGLRLSKSRKFMPNGMMLILTLATLALRHLKF
ncbi:MAG: TMEM14 family protein [Verrucomicrobia bacterium]|nr:TMEM14 family protein [Verrucomicrobiota bacterium]